MSGLARRPEMNRNQGTGSLQQTFKSVVLGLVAICTVMLFLSMMAGDNSFAVLFFLATLTLALTLLLAFGDIY